MRDIVTVTGTNNYWGSPLFGALNLSVLEMSYTHTERYLGW